MQKILSAIGIGSLTLVLLIALSFTSVSASSVQSSASEPLSSIDPQSTQIRFVEVKKYFANYPPATYQYNERGYKGTLKLVKVVDFGDHYQGTYQGNVQCTGVCPATKQLDK